MRLKSNKFNVLISLIVILLLTLFSSIYYYILHRSFWPDPESILLILRKYWRDLYGEAYGYNVNNVLMVVSEFVYNNWGISFKSVRLTFVIMHAFVLFILFYNTVFDFEKKSIKLYLIPIVVFIAVIINPGSTLYCGHIFEYYHMYPFDMHLNAMLFIMIGFFLLRLLQHYKKSNSIYSIIGILLFIYIGYKYSDAIFLMGFAVPYILEKIIRIWHANKKIIIYGFLIIICIIAGLRIISIFIPSISSLYEINGMSHVIYGDAGVADVSEIFNNIATTIAVLFSMFNIEIAGQSLISFYMIVRLIRVFIVLSVYALSVKATVSYLKNKNQYIDNTIQVVAAMGILINTLAVIIVGNAKFAGNNGYLCAVVYLSVIVICNYFENYNIEHGYRKQIIYYIAGIFTMLIIIDAKPLISVDDYKAVYEEPLLAISDYIEKNDLGVGYADYWVGPYLNALSNGKNLVLFNNYYPFSDAGNYIADDENFNNIKINYFIDSDIGTLGTLEYAKSRYGEPDEIIDFGHYDLVIYYEGVLIK